MEDCPDAKRGAAAKAAASLSDELILEILSHVPARSIQRFKCVSKRWRDLIADPLHQKLLPQTLGGFLCNDAFISLPGRPAPLIDASFSFLKKLPEMKNIRFFGSCNGLVLFEHRPDLARTPSYVVCNPATKQWVAVPSSSNIFLYHSDIYLIFDPATSPHFHLLHIAALPGAVIEVRVYSSETRGWSDRVSDQLFNVRWGTTSSGRVVFVSGMLYFIMWRKSVVTKIDMGKDEIVAMDREGKSRIIPLPEEKVCVSPILFVDQSQGRLHCMMTSRLGNGLNIWVLQDNDAGHWVLKHSVSYSELLGEMCNNPLRMSFTVVSIHPDCDWIFFIRYRDMKVGSQWKLLSYDMHSKELHTVHNFGHVYCDLTPYVPYFSESTVLANVH